MTNKKIVIVKATNVINVRVCRIIIVCRISSESFFLVHRLVQRVQDLEGDLAWINISGQDGIATKQIRPKISG